MQMTLELITIPISHFCEKARWALDRAELRYVERRYLQVLHAWPAKRAGGRSSVPVLITDDGVLKDSADILRFADENGAQLYPKEAAARDEVLALEKPLNEVLGPQGRLWMYAHFLTNQALVRKYGATGAPPWQKRLFPWVRPGVVGVLRRYIGGSADASVRAAEDVDRIFDQFAEQLSKGSGEYLWGARFTAADLTFAALAAPAVMPLQYGVELPSLDELPDVPRARIERWRAHPAGRHALRMFEQERGLRRAA